MSLCPSVCKNGKPNFYLRSLEKTNPAQWYLTHVLGVNAIRKTVTQMLKDAKLDGFFTNHSLRRSGTTRLFHAGVDRKIVKEFTGHSSDAVDNYQVTSEEQRHELSSIIAGNASEKVSVESVSKTLECNESASKPNLLRENTVELSVTDKTGGYRGCNCKLSNVNLD